MAEDAMTKLRSPVALAFFAGATVMAGEMAASRLVAPFFGTTTFVFGALVCIVLGAVAVGSYAGGRLADRFGRVTPLAAALAAAAGFLALAPVPLRVALSAAKTSLLTGHVGIAIAWVFSVLLVGVPPLVVLGAVSPYMARLTVEATETVGQRVGAISAASTVGSIVGTLAASFLVLPLCGTARCLAIFGLVLALAASLHLPRRYRVLAYIAPAAGLLLGPHALPPSKLASRVVESPYALLQVIDAPGSKRLVFNEGFATESVLRNGAELQGEPWDDYALAPMLAEPRDGPSRVLLLGLGAGTSARLIAADDPAREIVAVEIDPDVVALARSEFGLPPDVEVHVADARAYLESDARLYDAIVIDAFRFPYAPFQLLTEECFEAARAHLRPGGALVVNVGRWGERKAVVARVAGTMARVFPAVLAADAHNQSNTIVYAGRGDLRGRLARRAALLSPPRRAFALRVAGEMVPVAPAGEPLTDDHAPVEEMTDAILISALLDPRESPLRLVQP